jgi:hypothetical protein
MNLIWHRMAVDIGQRFEVRAFGYPLDGRWNVIAWSDDPGEADRAADGVRDAFGCSESKVVDRQALLEGGPSA